MKPQQQTIMLVEDSPNDVLLMREAMSQAGISNPLQVCMDGARAIAYLENPASAVPYLILLDLKLPQVMGLDVLRWIRSRPALSSIVVIPLSASLNDADVESAYRLHANGFLVKPTTFGELRQLAASIKEFWLVHNQVHPQFCPGPWMADMRRAG